MVKRLRSPEVQEKIRKAAKAKARSSETTQESPSKVLEPSLEEMVNAPVEAASGFQLYLSAGFPCLVLVPIVCVCVLDCVALPDFFH